MGIVDQIRQVVSQFKKEQDPEIIELQTQVLKQLKSIKANEV